MCFSLGEKRSLGPRKKNSYKGGQHRGLSTKDGIIERDRPPGTASCKEKSDFVELMRKRKRDEAK